MELLERELLERELDEEDLLELELDEEELEELEELEEDDVVFLRPGASIFLIFKRTFLSSRASSSSLMSIALIIFSAALSPT